MKTLLRWFRHPVRSWKAWRFRCLVDYLARVESKFVGDYLKANGIEDPDKFLRQVSESIIGPED